MWNQHLLGVLLIVVSSLPTDSFLFLAGENAGPTEWPTASFPEYTDDRLHGFVDHLWAASDGNLTAGVSVLSGPGLYTLTVALARAAGTGRQPSSRRTTDCSADGLDSARAADRVATARLPRHGRRPNRSRAPGADSSN